MALKFLRTHKIYIYRSGNAPPPSKNVNIHIIIYIHGNSLTSFKCRTTWVSQTMCWQIRPLSKKTKRFILWPHSNEQCQFEIFFCVCACVYFIVELGIFMCRPMCLLCVHIDLCMCNVYVWVVHLCARLPPILWYILHKCRISFYGIFKLICNEYN